MPDNKHDFDRVLKNITTLEGETFDDTEHANQEWADMFIYHKDAIKFALAFTQKVLSGVNLENPYDLDVTDMLGSQSHRYVGYKKAVIDFDAMIQHLAEEVKNDGH
jgi:hypothetical protein